MAIPNKSPLVLNKELITFLDTYRGEKSRNAYIVWLLRQYKLLIEAGVLTEAGTA